MTNQIKGKWLTKTDIQYIRQILQDYINDNEDIPSVIQPIEKIERKLESMEESKCPRCGKQNNTEFVECNDCIERVWPEI